MWYKRRRNIKNKIPPHENSSVGKIAIIYQIPSLIILRVTIKNSVVLFASSFNYKARSSILNYENENLLQFCVNTCYQRISHLKI